MNIEKGSQIEGVASGIADYGVFVNFANGYRGLIHISEISKKFVKSVSDYVNVGDKLICTVISVDHNNKKVSCSIKDSEFIENKEKKKDSGFAPLKEQLPNWIDLKIAEMNKKNYDR